METSKLSWYYSIACERAHEVIDEFYESLHSEEGLPEECKEIVEGAMERIAENIDEELSLIKSALDEYTESKQA